jgi:hypothetical protein
VRALQPARRGCGLYCNPLTAAGTYLCRDLRAQVVAGTMQPPCTLINAEAVRTNFIHQQQPKPLPPPGYNCQRLPHAGCRRVCCTPGCPQIAPESSNRHPCHQDSPNRAHPQLVRIKTCKDRLEHCSGSHWALPAIMKLRCQGTAGAAQGHDQEQQQQPQELVQQLHLVATFSCTA